MYCITELTPPFVLHFEAIARSQTTTLLLFYAASYSVIFVIAMYLNVFALFLILQIARVSGIDQSSLPGPSYEDLPPKAVFPGPWDANIQAPANKSHIRPKKIWKTEGDVTGANALVVGKSKNDGLIIRPGGLVTLEFPQNIAGR
jgi:hypothetical protein